VVEAEKHAAHIHPIRVYSLMEEGFPEMGAKGIHRPQVVAKQKCSVPNRECNLYLGFTTTYAFAR
jgi:hypothetical protein